MTDSIKTQSPARGDTTAPAHVSAIEANIAPSGAETLTRHPITTADAVAYEPIPATDLPENVVGEFALALGCQYTISRVP